MKRAGGHRSDANQEAIVERLRRIGVQVAIVGKPLDLVVCPTSGPLKNVSWFMEVKNRDGKDKITKDQAKFMAEWPGHIDIVYTPDEAVAAVLGEAMA